MIKPQQQKQDMTALMLIHTFLSFAVVAVLLFFFGCREIQEEKATLGSEVDAAAVNKAEVDARGNAHPFDMKKGEGAVYDYTYEIEGSAPTTFGQTSLQVLSREDILCKDLEGFDCDENDLAPLFLRVVFVGKEFDPDTGDTRAVQFPVIFDRAGDILQSQSADVFAIKEHQTDMLLTPNKLNPLNNDETKIIKTTYHDLKVSLVRMAPPIAVSSRANCGDVPNCELRVVKISYDIGLWTSETDFIKATIEQDFTLDTPYMGLVVRECSAMQEQVENRKYFIRRCRNLTNFVYE